LQSANAAFSEFLLQKVSHVPEEKRICRVPENEMQSSCAALVPDLNANLLLVVEPVQIEVKGALMSAKIGKVLVGLVAPVALVRLDPLVPVLVVQHLLFVHKTLQHNTIKCVSGAAIQRRGSIYWYGP
jgi:hypothetical protein